jgi:hypothetical protein
MTPPVCGTETGLRPEDFAVVDFAIGPDGRVIQANTVYTRGSANVAAEFARAVSKWVWDPETIKKIPAFFLFASRVEIRCTTAGQEMPGLIAPLQNRFQTWSATQLGLVGSPDRDVLATQLAALASASNPTIDPVRQVAILGLRPIVEPMSWLARYNMIEKALAVAGTNAIPAEARNYLMISQLAARLGFNRGKGTADNGDLLSLLATPDIANDPLAADTLKLLVAMSNSDRQGSANAAELLQQVALDSKLPEQHPLRQASYLGLANAAAKKGDFAKAQDYFKATGLTEEQCAFLGVKPAVRRTGIDSSDFPSGAYEFGFEGWVSLEFDIQNNGVPAGIRPLIAYPPFVFSEAAAKSANSFLFESSYRPSGGNACSAERRTLVYRFP